ncbi:hypothetical protein LEP1GSC199_0180 [Leptospira vanthielii serovar Holland str. Waz Holland = ATCC 700522]|uniref:Uncharacterized protein n=1 Tax=Leptospira vanthielii serovar Holland str. Waz Holland = ATCC 700522 TaxID=1218591 RepID=N1WGY3_9LEPT|nr:hypothetical protein LEP1GSC199_0180 [Leptospira vanthielii serovar Holland str. Waz Holland = ATCC 700522]
MGPCKKNINLATKNGKLPVFGARVSQVSPLPFELFFILSVRN